MNWNVRRRRRGVPAARPRSRWRLFGDVALAIGILGLAGLLAARLDRVETRQTSGRPVVNDGDTITLNGERIRLIGIDAPEFDQVCRRDGQSYDCGQSARKALVELVGDGMVVCVGWERDRYGRLLGACRAGSTQLNRSLVAEGWAVAYGDFEAEEASARQRKVGLWAGDFDPPRRWREMRGGMVESVHDFTGAVFNWLREMFRFS